MTPNKYLENLTLRLVEGNAGGWFFFDSEGNSTEASMSDIILWQLLQEVKDAKTKARSILDEEDIPSLRTVITNSILRVRR